MKLTLVCALVLVALLASSSALPAPPAEPRAPGLVHQPAPIRGPPGPLGKPKKEVDLKGAESYYWPGYYGYYGYYNYPYSYGYYPYGYYLG